LPGGRFGRVALSDTTFPRLPITSSNSGRSYLPIRHFPLGHAAKLCATDPGIPIAMTILREVLIMFLLQLLVALVVVAAAGWLINSVITVPGNIRPILNVVLALVVVGIALELINTYVPMAGSIKAILNVVVVVATCVGVFKALGLWNRVVQLWSDITSRHQISQ
jgi:hypothetical protein